MRHTSTFFQQIFFIVFALTVCSQCFCKQNEIDEEIRQNYMQEFYNAFGKQMEGEFNLKWIEDRFPHNTLKKYIEFYAQRRATIEEARALELSILNKLSEAIQNDPKMFFYLNQISLTPESIRINIHFVNLQNFGYDDGSVDDVYFYSDLDEDELQKRYLKYSMTDPFTGYPIWIEETFEEAVKLNAEALVKNPGIHLSRHFEDELNKVLASFIEEMKKKYGLFFRSSGWMIAGKSTSDITKICAKCTYYYSVDSQEARMLILLASEKLLIALNNNEVLRPYLKEYPFPASSLKLRMLFRKHDSFVGDRPYYDGSMDSVILSENKITYYHHIPNADNERLHDEVVYAEESYEDAQQKIENAPPPTLFEKGRKRINHFILNFAESLDTAVKVFLLFSILFLGTDGCFFIIFVILCLIFLLYLRRISKAR